jgi:hypothetical protein
MKTVHIILLAVMSLLSGTVFGAIIPPDLARYYSAITLASGPHNTAFVANVSGISFNPAGISVAVSPQVLVSYGVTSSNQSILRTAFVSPLSKKYLKGAGGFVDFSWTISSLLQKLEPRLGAGWSRGWFHSGILCGLELAYPTEKKPESRWLPEAGIIVSPGPFRAGLTLSWPEGGIPESRLQAGGNFLKKRVHLSAGVRQIWENGYTPIPNAGIDLFLWDFLNASASFEDRSWSAGFSLNSYSTRLGFAFCREKKATYSYSLSFNIQQ